MIRKSLVRYKFEHHTVVRKEVQERVHSMSKAITVLSPCMVALMSHIFFNTPVLRLKYTEQALQKLRFFIALHLFFLSKAMEETKAWT